MTLETFLDDIADYIEDHGLSPVDIAGNFESFANGIHIIPYGGIPPTDVVTGANPIGLDFQILVKNDDQRLALAQVFRLMRLLGDVSNTQIGDTFFMFIQLKYGAFFVGKTNSGHYQYTLNFTLLIH